MCLSSGLMIIAAAMKCENLGYFTNVVTTHSQEYSNDIYGHMGGRVTDLVTDEEERPVVSMDVPVVATKTKQIYMIAAMTIVSILLLILLPNAAIDKSIPL